MSIHVKRLLSIGLLTIVTAAVTTSSMRAEQDSARKITKKVTAAYPVIARKLLLSGTVRLAAVVAAAGQVKSTEVLGGHPLLVAAAMDAAKKWTYQSADRDSREVMVFTFAPTR
jgi:TonB family protein